MEKKTIKKTELRNEMNRGKCTGMTSWRKDGARRTGVDREQYQLFATCYAAYVVNMMVKSDYAVDRLLVLL